MATAIGDGSPASHHLAASLTAYEERHLPCGTKGLALAAPMRQSELKLRQWRVLEAGARAGSFDGSAGRHRSAPGSRTFRESRHTCHSMTVRCLH
jgi:hypothetical protein